MAVKSRLEFLMKYSLASDIVLDLPNRFIPTWESDVPWIVNNILVNLLSNIFLGFAPFFGIEFKLFLFLCCIFRDSWKRWVVKRFYIKAAAIVVELDLFGCVQDFGQLFFRLVQFFEHERSVLFVPFLQQLFASCSVGSDGTLGVTLASLFGCKDWWHVPGDSQLLR